MKAIPFPHNRERARETAARDAWLIEKPKMLWGGQKQHQVSRGASCAPTSGSWRRRSIPRSSRSCISGYASVNARGPRHASDGCMAASRGSGRCSRAPRWCS